MSQFTTDMGVLAGIAELNNRFEWYYGDVEPVSPRPFLNWGHLSADLWKQRNAENTDWIIRGKLSEAYFGINTYIEGVKKYRLLVTNGSLAMEEVS